MQQQPRQRVHPKPWQQPAPRRLPRRLHHAGRVLRREVLLRSRVGGRRLLASRVPVGLCSSAMLDLRSNMATRSEAGSSSKANGPLLKKGGKGKEEPLKKRASWFSLKRLMPSSSSQEKYASAAVDATPPSKSNNKRSRSFSLRKPSFGGSMRSIGRSFSFMPAKSARRQSRDNLAARTAFHESKAERKRRDSESTPSAPASARQESEESVEFGV